MLHCKGLKMENKKMTGVLFFFTQVIDCIFVVRGILVRNSKMSQQFSTFTKSDCMWDSVHFPGLTLLYLLNYYGSIKSLKIYKICVEERK